MRAINVGRATWLIVAISAMAWIGAAVTTNSNLSDIREFLRFVPSVVTVDATVMAAFIGWGWRWSLFRGWLVTLPDLNGTWLGEIQSDHEDERGQHIPPVPAMMTVRQSLLGISCVVLTQEMRSDSYAEGFRLDPERQLRQLAYSYSSRPSLLIRKRSAPHDGTAVLDVLKGPNRRLRGRYWTERGTVGEMDFSYHGRHLLEELPLGIPSHPMRVRDSL